MHLPGQINRFLDLTRPRVDLLNSMYQFYALALPTYMYSGHLPAIYFIARSIYTQLSGTIRQAYYNTKCYTTTTFSLTVVKDDASQGTSLRALTTNVRLVPRLC